jgi:hypothetical protein
MDLQREPVIEAHLRHLGKHLRAEGPALGCIRLAGADFSEQRVGFVEAKVRRLGRGVTVVG